MITDNLEIVDAYHQRSKHQLQRYAAGPETLDWDAQPDPFRRYAGSPTIPLALLRQRLENIRYADLYRPGAVAAAPWSLENIAALYQLAFGLSAWKQYGTASWALRCNPSSGNLHPTEAYLAHRGVTGLAGGVYHYRSDEHLLEARCQYKAPSREQNLPTDTSLLLGLSSIHWREAWKYGERAWRYVQLDVGHAIACVRYAAAVLGWQAQIINNTTDQQISRLLGLDREEDFADAEQEHPDILLAISRTPIDTDPQQTLQELLQLNDQNEWQGQANRLDPKPIYTWPVIGEITAACEKQTPFKTDPFQHETSSRIETASSTPSASALIKQRRSAQAFDSKTVMPQTVFYRMLDKLLPHEHLPPWDSTSSQPQIHPVLFVHRVAGLANGVYALPRHAAATDLLKSSLRDAFKWEKPEGCPQHLPLYLLVAANCQNAARTVSCHQDIASDSAFSLAMLAEYRSVIDQAPWRYRDLYWEAGILGQALYLEAEAAGLRGTGIGCFFDDAVHETLGINGNDLQDLYHFTVGAPIIDQRLVSLPPYGHIKDR